MGRHADPTAPARRPAPVVLIAAGIVAVLLAGGLVWWLAGSGEDCDTRETVAVTVAPELGDVTAKLLADPIVLDDLHPGGHGDAAAGQRDLGLGLFLRVIHAGNAGHLSSPILCPR